MGTGRLADRDCRVNSAFVLWILLLADYRFRETLAEKWLWLFPVGLALVAATWAWPLAWSLALVYLHPLVAIWFLDRELGRRRPRWQTVYRRGLMLIPVLVGVLWWRLADAPDLPGGDLLSMQITQHAGANLLSGVSSRFLVACAHFFGDAALRGLDRGDSLGGLRGPALGIEKSSSGVPFAGLEVGHSREC